MQEITDSSQCPVLPEEDEPGLTATLQVLRHRGGEVASCPDSVAEEWPVSLVFNGISHAVMMTTPADLEVFALGFSLSEGIVSSVSEVFDIEVRHHKDGSEVMLEIAQPAFLRLKEHRRSLVGRTGCGVCGTESLAMLDLTPEKVLTSPVPVGQPELLRALTELPQYQKLTQETGCAHAAAWCSPQGGILRAFEDVGRHNALDKLLGWLARNGQDTSQGFVFLTSRASYELVRKAARCNVPLMATISAPTALAIRIAWDSGIRLMSFCRQNGFVEYPQAHA